MRIEVKLIDDQGRCIAASDAPIGPDLPENTVKFDIPITQDGDNFLFGWTCKMDWTVT